MGKRYPNPRLVKINYSYTVEEASTTLGKHKNTVRSWIKDGLPTIDDKRPLLIQGRDLVTFLQERRAKNKQTCKIGELYCVRCRKPQLPAESMAEFSPITEKFGNLIAICPECGSIMNRRVSLSKISNFRKIMDISFPEDFQRIIESVKPSENCDLERRR